MKAKRIACFILTMMLVAGTIPAQAIELTTPGGKVTTDVTLEANGSGQEPEIFSVTVPTELPIRMDKNGNITTGDNLFIENHSSKDVKVTAISVEGKNGWSIADYGEDFSAKELNTKELGLSLRGDATRAGGQVVLTPENWVVKQEESLDIMASARLGRQSKSDESDIAVIDWTLDWADVDTKPDIPAPPVTNLTVEYENGLMLPGSSNSATFRWNSTDRNTSLVSVTSASPEIADVNPAAAMAIYRDEETVEIVAHARGTAVFTGTTNTGETASFTVQVSELDTSKTQSVSIKDENALKAGDKILAEDVTVSLPIISPDGTEETAEFQPETIPELVLKEGENPIDISVNIGSKIITVSHTVIIPNPANNLIMTVAEAKAEGFTFDSYEDGLMVKDFENVNFKSNIVVPAQVGDFKVVAIGRSAFNRQTNLNKITLPDCIADIQQYAFSNCSSLKEINLPKSLTKIGSEAFKDCESLNCDLIFYNNVKVTTDALHISPFVGCTSRPNLIFKESVTSIPADLLASKRRDWAVMDSTLEHPTFGTITVEYCNPSWDSFHEYTEYTVVNASKIVIKRFAAYSGNIPSHAFHGCRTPVFEIPGTVTKIGDDAFGNLSIGIYGLSKIPVEHLYYGGTKSQWSNVVIGKNNDMLKGATIHFSDGSTMIYS